ncbi:phosphatidylglycerophosphatase A family protein [Psittacicella hinzii]|nr:phosphatidylglycerophosphatase A [Psittacicella hinzii]
MFYRYNLFSHYKGFTGKASLFLASFFTVGLFRPAPGTWGSAAASLVCWYLFTQTSQTHWYTNLLFWAVVQFFVGWLCTWALKRQDGKEDPSYVVIDETAAVFFVNGIIYFYIGLDHSYYTELIGYITFVNFLFFRFDDIIKVGLTAWADCLNTPLGVMLDDIFAALTTIAKSIILLLVLSYFGWDESIRNFLVA